MLRSITDVAYFLLVPLLATSPFLSLLKHKAERFKRGTQSSSVVPGGVSHRPCTGIYLPGRWEMERDTPWHRAGETSAHQAGRGSSSGREGRMLLWHFSGPWRRGLATQLDSQAGCGCRAASDRVTGKKGGLGM